MTPRVLVDGVSVLFPLYHSGSFSLKKTLVRAASDRIARSDAAGAPSRVVVHALRDVSFTLHSGDRLGLVGRNGAGKTTLLRTLAGIYEPVVGHVRIEGRFNALLDPNLGMNAELTGRENIRLRGRFHGLGADALPALEADVQDFADLGAFLDLPTRTYSSGMLIRLGFALATAVRPQILMMDEWFLAGDASFMERARQRMEDLVRGADILVLSSHQNAIIREWCTRVLWMEDGRVRADGPPDEVLAAYMAAA